MMERGARMARQGDQMPPQRCPRCDSTHTKFCYFNNYSSSQPRYFCKACRRYWTHGGTLRNVPQGGGGGRKGKRSKKSPSSAAAAVASPPTTQPGQIPQVDHEVEVEPMISAGLDASTPVMPYLYYGGGMELGGGGAAVGPLFETQFHYGLNLMTPPPMVGGGGGGQSQQAGWQQVSGGGAAAINPAAGDGGEGYWRELMFSAGDHQGSTSNWAAEMARRGPRAPPFI